MSTSLRRHIFAVALAIAILVIVSSCFIAYRALNELPAANRKIVVTRELLVRLGTLQSSLRGTNSRIRDLSLPGNQQDRIDLFESIARTQQLLDDVRNGNDPDSVKLVEEIGTYLETLRAANTDGRGLDDQELADLQQQAKHLLDSITKAVGLEGQQLTTLEDDLRNKRGQVTVILLAGHGLMLATLGVLYVARQTEWRLRQTADRRMLAADERFALIVRGSTDGIIVTDAAGRIAITNPAMAAMLGTDEDALCGQAVSRFFTTTVIDEWLANQLDGKVEDQVLARRVRATRVDGKSFLAELTITPRNIHGEEFLAIAVHDVTEREASRLRLKQHEALLTEIPEPLHILDAVGRVVYWNRGAEQLYGYEASEAIGQTANDLLRIIPPRVELKNGYAQNYADTERWSGELRATNKAGKSLRIERRRTRIMEHGESVGEVILDLDLGERTRLQRVERRRQRLESLGTLSSGIAHDLNNLLTPILMSSKMLQRENANIDRAALLETISSGATRGAELIAQLLTFARGGDGQHQPIDFATFLPEIVAILERMMPRKLVMKLDVPSNLPQVFGDAIEISQVVMNLAINARDAMPDEGTLSITASRLKLSTERSYSTTTLQPGKYVVISVADTGTGIPASIRDRIFDPFFSTKERGQGTGLGLSTTIGIVNSHHGAIGIQSTVGKGTTFSVVLPEYQP